MLLASLQGANRGATREPMGANRSVAQDMTAQRLECWRVSCHGARVQSWMLLFVVAIDVIAVVIVLVDVIVVAIISCKHFIASC